MLERPGLSDRDIIMEMVRDVGWPHRADDVSIAMTLGNPWVVRRGPDAGPVGIAVWWAFGETAGRLGLVIVSPEEQGRGLGKRLVRRCLDEAGDRALTLLATDEGRSLYERHGFRVTESSQRHQGVLDGARLASPRTRPARHGDHDELISLDATVIGADRSAILRHLFEVGQTTLLMDDDRIAGYVVTRAFGRGSVVGPIVASSERDAIELFEAGVPAGIVRVDRPLWANRFGAHLTSRGIAGHEESEVMVFSDWPTTTSAFRVFAMASHAWG